MFNRVRYPLLLCIGISVFDSAQAQAQVHRCVVEGRTVFQETPCSTVRRSPDPVAPANAQKRPDAEALRAEQARRREELQKGFRDVQVVPRSTQEPPLSSSVQSTSTSMAFEDCIRTIQRISGQIGVVPRNIVETSDVRMVRLNTRDGSVIVTCSRADRKMVTTVSQN